VLAAEFLRRGRINNALLHELLDKEFLEPLFEVGFEKASKILLAHSTPAKRHSTYDLPSIKHYMPVGVSLQSTLVSCLSRATSDAHNLQIPN